MAGHIANQLRTHDFQDRTLPRQGLWLVDFGGAWCPPCRVIAPILGELAKTYAGRLEIAEVDADEEAELAARFQVASLPTLLLFRDGQLIDRKVGAAPRSTLVKWIESAMG